MKKAIFLLNTLLFVFLYGSCLAYAESSLISVVNSSTSDRVHLRTEASIHSASKGLYFNGTPVITQWGQGYNEWTPVVIGAEQGYIHSSLLSPIEHPHDFFEIGKSSIVVASGSVNIRSAPTKKAPVLTTAEEGDTVAILGETIDRWYYVFYQDTYGYIMSKYLQITDAPYIKQLSNQFILPISDPITCIFSSGAGAWSTQMIVFPDGAFLGYFHDSDMGVYSDIYPNGTLYECSFAGCFSNATRVNDWEFQMTVDMLQIFGILETQVIRDQTLVITTDSYGIKLGEKFSLFLSNTPKSHLPNDYIREYVHTPSDIALFYGHSSQSEWRIE